MLHDRASALPLPGQRRAGLGRHGLVCRAEDTPLGCEVALKVLPEEMAADPERLERFKREAQVIAALNHSRVVTSL